jgi:hypothetical protein
MPLPREVVEALEEACEKLGEDGEEIRELLEAGDLPLALEVLIDQYEGVELPLPPVLAPFALLARLRSDLEELVEWFAAEDGASRVAQVHAALAEVEAALEGGELPAEVGRRLAGWFAGPEGLEAPGDPRVKMLLGRVAELVRRLGEPG